ncbi:MAG: arsenate reductase ArsC [Sediminibacterium sp.]|nr:arsenate reductase ArsC [Sediminibacterium sp.]
MKNILILCTGNSCRSQMAHGYLLHFTKNKMANIYSAGIKAHGVNPNAIKSMKEDGIDISTHTSNKINEYKNVSFDFIITVCDNAKENCPIFPSSAIKIHFNFPDPAKATGTDDEISNQFNQVRLQIKNFCFDFVEKYL